MNVHDLVASVKSLPPAPRILVRLLEAVRDPDADSAHVLEVLQLDPALTAEVIRLSNTAYFSPTNPAATLEEAVARLGYLEVYRLAARIPVSDMFSSAIEPMGLAAGELWEHSLACAIVADELSERAGLPAGLAYTAALLHDVGKLVLREAASAEYDRVFTLVEAEQMPLNEAERAVFGFDHAEAGAVLLEQWKFPPEVHLAVRHQYRPADCPEPRFLAAAVLVANWVAAAIGCNHGRDVWAISIDDDARELVDLQPAEIEPLVCQTTTRLRAAMHLVAHGR